MITYNKGENNSFSVKIKAIDENGKIVGVYGSIRECCRCILNLKPSYLCKILKKNGNYKNISKKYKYLYCSDEEYYSNKSVLKVNLVESRKMDKRPTEFLVIYLDNKKIEKWDNQTQLSKKLNIPQATISKYVKNESIVGNIKFKKLKKIDYIDSSGYNNMINNIEDVNIRNVFTGEVLSFKTIEKLKNHFNIKGHLTRNSYNLIFSEWEII